MSQEPFDGDPKLMLALCRITLLTEPDAIRASARDFAVGLAVPVFVVDRAGNLSFYNEAAGTLLGLSFEQAGEMSSVRWSLAFDPKDEHGRPIAPPDLPLVVALDERRPAHRKLSIVAAGGTRRTVEITAFPLLGADSRHHGAVAVFWETKN